MIDETIACEECGLTLYNIPSWLFHKMLRHETGSLTNPEFWRLYKERIVVHKTKRQGNHGRYGNDQ